MLPGGGQEHSETRMFKTLITEMSCEIQQNHIQYSFWSF